MTCQMGQVLSFAGSHRRGFNALKLKDLGLVSAVSVPTGSSSRFLTALYNYEFDVPGVNKLLQLSGTQVYLSFRSAREWTVDRSNNFGSKYMSFGNTINGVTHVHTLNAQDGSSTLIAIISTGQTYVVPGTSFSVRQDWTTNLGAQLSISSTGSLPAAIPEPAPTYPAAGTTLWNSGIQDTAEQGSTASGSYGGSAVLNINWAGDDRNSSVFIRAQVNVPAASNIVSATLVLEADTDQLQAQQGTTQSFIAAEQSLNPQTYSGNLRSRTYFPRVATAFSGDYFVGDEIRVDVRTQVQQVVSQTGWMPGNHMSLTIFSAVVNQQLTRTAQSGYGCGLIGGTTLCGPRMRIVYTSSGGGQPAPVNCVSSWSAWSVCTNTAGTCGSAGTQERNLLVSVPAANGGTPCPTPTRETRSCTTEPCVVVIKVERIRKNKKKYFLNSSSKKNCIWTWGPWSACAGSCSSFGSRSRSIIISQLPDPTGVQCPTVQTETDNTCLTAACPPIDCIVEYTNWGTCSGACGTSSGTQNRTGVVRISPQYGGASCPPLFQTQSCTTPACIQDCVVVYGSFGECVGTCGGLTGTQTKTGTVVQAKIGAGASCPPLVVSQSCRTAACPPRDCVYSWSFSECSGGACGASGTQTRTAIVLSPAVGSGQACPAPSIVACQMPACVTEPVSVFPLAETAMSGTLSTGSLLNLKFADGIVERITESNRAIDYVWLLDSPRAASLQLKVVVGVSNLAGQTIQFQWAFLGSPWVTALTVSQSSTQTYTVTLSAALTQARILYIRMVNSDRNTVRSSLTAVSIDQLLVAAAVPPAVVAANCIQGEWVASACSTRCGTGTQTLTRPTLQQPSSGGTPCGASSSSQSCSEFTQCPDNCVVSSWSNFSACSATCGSGTITRTRTIVRPASNGGTACPNLTETIPCGTNLPPCSASCVYGPWTPSGSCSVACGGGTQLLVRSATGPGCRGSSTSTQSCNTQACPGSTFLLRLQAILSQSGGVYYQSWPTASNVITPEVSLILSGRATDLSATLLSNAYWQLITNPGASIVCSVTSVTLTCPVGTIVATTNIANVIGKAQCQNSLGAFATLAAIQFTILC